MARLSHRSNILAAGRELIHRAGYAASGVAEITAEAGVPKGSFYNHFESKEAFALEALDAYWAAAAPVRGLLAESGPALDRVRRHFVAIADTMRPSGFSSGCLIGNMAIESAQSEPLRQRVAEILAEWTHELAAALSDGQVAGEITVRADADTLACYLVASWEGVVQRAKVERDEAAIRAFDAVLDTILKA